MEHPYRPVPTSPETPFRMRASIARSSRKIAVLAGLALAITAATFVARAEVPAHRCGGDRQARTWAARVAEENARADQEATLRARRIMEAHALVSCTPETPCAHLHVLPLPGAYAAQ